MLKEVPRGRYYFTLSKNLFEGLLAHKILNGDNDALSSEVRLAAILALSMVGN
jgi:hypothetical protein